MIYPARSLCTSCLSTAKTAPSMRAMRAFTEAENDDEKTVFVAFPIVPDEVTETSIPIFTLARGSSPTIPFTRDVVPTTTARTHGLRAPAAPLLARIVCQSSAIAAKEAPWSCGCPMPVTDGVRCLVCGGQS